MPRWARTDPDPGRQGTSWGDRGEHADTGCGGATRRRVRRVVVDDPHHPVQVGKASGSAEYLHPGTGRDRQEPNEIVSGRAEPATAAINLSDQSCARAGRSDRVVGDVQHPARLAQHRWPPQRCGSSVVGLAEGLYAVEVGVGECLDPDDQHGHPIPAR
jgi:hypothetical protein